MIELENYLLDVLKPECFKCQICKKKEAIYRVYLLNSKYSFKLYCEKCLTDIFLFLIIPNRLIPFHFKKIELINDGL